MCVVMVWRWGLGWCGGDCCDGVEVGVVMVWRWGLGDII